MKLSSKPENILDQINSKTKLGDLRTIAKEIKKDRELATELWSTGRFLPRQLAILIMDSKRVSQELVNQLNTDMQTHPFEERNQLMDWLMANQLLKDKKNIALVESWENSPFALQRRVFWYYQARLRWLGKIPVDNAAELYSRLLARIHCYRNPKTEDELMSSVKTTYRKTAVCITAGNFHVEPLK